MVLISVIIPAYNRKALLPRALSSVLSQRLNDFEVIIIDDGSNDGTDTLELLRSDHRIRYCKKHQNYGVSKARNTGIQLSTGKWIALLDSDDEWTPDKLHQQIEWLNKNSSFQIAQSKEIWIRNGQRVNPPISHEKFQGDLFEASLKRCMITPSSVIFTRELIEIVGGFNESLPACEDYDLWLRITCNHLIGLVPQFHLRRFSGHADQLSSSIPILDRFRIRSLLELLHSGKLSLEQKKSVHKNLHKRANIVAQGNLKRGNQELYLRYLNISRSYT